MQKNKTDVVKAVCNSAAKKLIALSLAGLVSGTVVANAQQPGNAPQPGSSQPHNNPDTFCGIPRSEFQRVNLPIPEPNEDPVAFLYKVERSFAEALLNAEFSFNNSELNEFLQKQRMVIDDLNEEFRSRGTFSVDTAALQQLGLPQPEQGEPISSFLGRLNAERFNILCAFFNVANSPSNELQLVGDDGVILLLANQNFLFAWLREAIPLPVGSDTPEVFINRVENYLRQAQEDMFRPEQDLGHVQWLNNRNHFLSDLYVMARESATRGTLPTRTEIENLAQSGVPHTLFDPSKFR